MDHNLPSISSTYANFVSLLDERLDDITVGLDPTVTASAATNLKVGAIRWTSSTSKWEKFAGGTTWNDLAETYAISISGTANNATNLGGLALAATSTSLGPAWNTVPRINSAGRADIGSVLDFHNTPNSSSDFSVRLSTNSTVNDLYVTRSGGTATKILTEFNIFSSSVNISGSAASIANTGGWSITPSGTILYLNYNGINVGKLDSSGNLTVKGTITQNGTV